MRILITGASGFLGNQILKYHNANSIKTLGRQHADYNYDIQQQIPKFTQQFDIIIHAAGKAHEVPKIESEKAEFFNINVKGTQNLLKAFSASPGLPKAFVFISSVAVYGKDSGLLIDENEPLLATDPYGLSKIQAEQTIWQWCNKNNIICTILRLPLVAGPNPPGNLKAMIKGIKKGYYFNIALGKAKKSIVLAKDVARIIPVAANIGGIYNLTDGYHPSFSELSHLIAKQLGKSKPSNIPMWVATSIAVAGDLIGSKAPINSNKLIKLTSDLTFDDYKARKLLGWEPTPVLSGFRIT